MWYISHVKCNAHHLSSVLNSSPNPSVVLIFIFQIMHRIAIVGAGPGMDILMKYRWLNTLKTILSIEELVHLLRYVCWKEVQKWIYLIDHSCHGDYYELVWHQIIQKLNILHKHGRTLAIMNPFNIMVVSKSEKVQVNSNLAIPKLLIYQHL